MRTFLITCFLLLTTFLSNAQVTVNSNGTSTLQKRTAIGLTSAPPANQMLKVECSDSNNCNSMSRYGIYVEAKDANSIGENAYGIYSKAFGYVAYGVHGEAGGYASYGISGTASGNNAWAGLFFGKCLCNGKLFEFR
ncbi:MAG: hypothetical protein WD059_08535 [Balneolaceae bacterium]